MSLQPYWEDRLHAAIKTFWGTRGSQAIRQGIKSGSRDAGNRTAVTGGKQMDGFVELVRDFLIECGIAQSSIFCNQAVELPGWFRAEKKWDLVVVVKGQLIATMEFKSQVGSFGNNFNNRSEESLGSATDIWTAYREGAFALSQRPWLGYVMVLEEVEKSLSPVGVKEPHFPVFPEFREASYAKRYEILMTKLVRERLYDSAALLLSNQSSEKDGSYRQPSNELSFESLLISLKARAMAITGASN
ncbi:MAG: PaeR7I family type II restriction endonuclease [Terracidiphilus sp.]|jgi:hypothetical protein